MKFGPADANEAIIFAVEELKANTQYEIIRALARAGMSQADLARKLGVTQSWVSQALSDDANLTLDTIAKIFLGLDLQCRFAAGPVEPHFAQSTTAGASRDNAWVHPDKDDVLPKQPARDTTALLMKAIQDSCSRKRQVTQVNDNNGVKLGKQATAA